jgi:hypothetical protein
MKGMDKLKNRADFLCDIQTYTHPLVWLQWVVYTGDSNLALHYPFRLHNMQNK